VLSGGASAEMLTGGDGGYTFVELPGDEGYELLLSHELYLAIRLVECVAPAGETTEMPEVTLLGGDLNGDLVIDISDLVIGGAHFGSDSAEADITADGQVDIFDIVLIGKNFGTSGPVVYECP
jgi:hypothetical protein